MFAFDSLVRSPIGTQNIVRQWEQAAALYEGPLLAGWTGAWVETARRGRRLQYETLLRRLVDHALLEKQAAAAERWVRLLRAARPGDEDALRTLLGLLHETGRDTEALTLFDEENLARTEAGASFEAATLELGEAIVQGATHGVTNVSDLAPPPEVARDCPPALSSPTMRGAPGHDSIVLVKGARQAGKTSLLARGLRQARTSGTHVVLTDFRKFNAEQLATSDTFCRALAALLASQLDLPVAVRDVWDMDFGPNVNLECFLCRQVLPAIPGPLIWAMDDVDRLFPSAFGSDVFGLFRSWHNERSLDPDSILGRLTLAISYATEAHLFIQDLDQSPFNVGTPVMLADFTPEQVTDLNERYGSPLEASELASLMRLVGGQPYLVRRGLDQAASGVSVELLGAGADREDGNLFGDHLRRLRLALAPFPLLLDALRRLMAAGPDHNEGILSPDDFYRLRAVGILTGASSQEAWFRCPLYAQYFARQFGLPHRTRTSSRAGPFA